VTSPLGSFSVSNAATSSPSTVNGLVSGLNTTQIISQLMQLAAQPQTNLKNQQQKEQSVVTAYQAVNSSLSALRTAADTLSQPTAWDAVTASSSSSTVTATATTGASVGNLTFDVTKLATAHVLTDVLPSSGPVTSGFGLDISIGGASPAHLDISDDTPQGVTDAINSAGLGVRASLVNTDQGQVLQLAATTTGQAAAFTVSGLTNNPGVLVQGSDAQITVGNPAAGGYTVSSPTDTFTGVLPGVTFTASTLQSGVTVSVAADAGSIADKVAAMVTAANTALSGIGTQTAYSAAAKAGSPLTGDSTVRHVQELLLSDVSVGQSGYGSFAQFGVQLTQKGQLTFDRNAFLVAYQANPGQVQSAVSTGLAAALKMTATDASDPATGAITQAIQSANSTITSLNNQISDWGVRLAAQQTALQRQFANLEVVLGKLQNQAGWLAGQISGLSSGSSSGSSSSSGG